jgi:hypothetical protein
MKSRKLSKVIKSNSILLTGKLVISFIAFKPIMSIRKVNILFSPERTVEDLILTFFRRLDQEDLFTKGGVAFIYNALQFSYHTKEKVKNFFKYNTNPAIMVVDVNNLIGA